jgi:hypothetical protein
MMKPPEIQKLPIARASRYGGFALQGLSASALRATLVSCADDDNIRQHV